MAERDGQEKTEQATGKKLEDSRNEGKVARSQELNSLAVFTTGLLVLFFTKDYLGSKLWSMSTYIFSSLDTLELSVNVLSLYGMKAAMFFVAAVFPVLLAIVIISFAVGYGQVGFRFTPKALQPKLNKLNPITVSPLSFANSNAMLLFPVVPSSDIAKLNGSSTKSLFISSTPFSYLVKNSNPV